MFTGSNHPSAGQCQNISNRRQIFHSLRIREISTVFFLLIVFVLIGSPTGGVSVPDLEDRCRNSSLVVKEIVSAITCTGMKC